MKKIVFGALVFLLGLAFEGTAFAQALLPAIPPNITTSAPRPMVMLNMSRDHQLFYRAYDEFSDLTGDGIPETTYKHSFDYYGYFDSYKCYTYSGTSSRFEPTSVTANKYCSGNWSGNFLNWATMTRMDIVRKVLYGGARSSDTGSLAVLERTSLPTDAHSFAKYYKGSDLPLLTPFDDELSPSKLISNNNTANAGRVNQFVAALNTQHVNTPGATPIGSTALSCAAQVDALYPNIVIDPSTGAIGPDPSKPTNYHCVTHSVAITTAYNIQVGDQIRVSNADDLTQYMQGVALNVDPLKAWVTLLVPQVGFVNPSATVFQKWLTFNLTQTSATICNTTLGNNVGNIANIASNAAVNGDSHTNTNPPIMRVARGDYQLWNANERWQCYWSEEKAASNGNNVAITGLGAGSSNPGKTSQGVTISGSGPDFVVRVTACTSGLIGKENCRQYPSGSFKPIGLLHEYGEGNLAEFGLFTGSYAKNISGGVLRSNVGSFRNEVNYLTDGTYSSAQGIVYTLNKLRIYGYRYSDGTYIGDNNCTYQLTGLVDNKCSSWGNPMGTMFVESLRYLGGLTASSLYDYAESGSKDAAMGLPHPTWVDPFTRGTAVEQTFGQGQCRAVNAINFNASVTSYDGDDARNQWAPFTNLPGSPSLINYINIIGNDEGIHGNSWFIGNGGTVNNRTCTGKTIASLAAVNGLCPDAPGYFGSYALAGAAYYARNNSVYKTVSAAQLKANPDAFKVKSFSVALSPGKPRIEIPHPTDATKKIIIQPSYQLVTGGTFGAGTLVDFRVIGTPTATSGKFLIVWEDSEQGGDYDTDVSGILRYDVVGTTVYIYTQVFYAATANPQGFGYTISGTAKDGVHFHSGILNYSFTDPTTLTATQSDGSAHPNINTSGGCTGCQSGQAESRATYTFSGSTAGQLPDPLWLAAKWGGISKVTDPASTTDPKGFFTKPTADKSNWDVKKLDGTSGGDGIPDSYFLAIRPSELEKALRSAFDAIVGTSNTAPAVASAQIQEGSLKYLASFDGDDGHGELLTFKLLSTGKFDQQFKADGSIDRTYNFWAAHPKLTALAAADRNVITNSGNTTGLAFDWNLSNTIKNVAFGGTDSTAQAKLNWLRGDRTNEAPSGLAFKKRNTNSTMGPVVNSNPVVVGRAGGNYFGSAFPGFGEHVTANLNRTNVVWVGAGDGMLHAFNASETTTTGGTPIISYVPQLIHSRLTELVDPASPKIQSFVDGSPFAGEVLPTTGGWKTYLFSALGRGAKGVFALDVTNPANLTQANAASIFKWQFSTADDASGDLGYNLAEASAIHTQSGQATPIVRMANGKFAVLQPNGISSSNGSAALYILFVDGPTSGTWSTPANYIKLVADTGPNNGLAQPNWVDVDSDGIVDYIYAGDLKGNVWRFDVRSADTANWKVSFANSDGTNKRPLFIAKDGLGNRLPITATVMPKFHPKGGILVAFATGKAISTTDFPDLTGRTHGVFGVWDDILYSSTPYLTTPTKWDDTTPAGTGLPSPGLPRSLSELAIRTLNRVTLDDTDPNNGVVGDGYITGTNIDWAVKKGWYVNFPGSSEMTVSNPKAVFSKIAIISIAAASSTAETCFKGPQAYLTFIDLITGLAGDPIGGSITIGGVTYPKSSGTSVDQNLTFVRVNVPPPNCTTNPTDPKCICLATPALCKGPCDDISAATVVGVGTISGDPACSKTERSRLYWREIPGLKTR